MFNTPKNGYTDRVFFDTNTLEKGHHKMMYKDVPMIKCPFDYVLYQMIFWEVKPDLVIEIGTNRGGAALYYADMLDSIGNGVVHTVDIEDMVLPQVKAHPRIRCFLNGFAGYDLSNASGFEKVLIIEDASHLYEDVKDTLHKFKDLVSVDSYFIIEDGILDKLGWKKKYNGGPNKAIKEFINNNPGFMIDRKWCDFFGVNATFNTNGFLKRIV
jgi:cephalosporin hydroxylase